MIVSVHQVAKHVHEKNGTNVSHWVYGLGAYSGGFYAALGLPMLAGCYVCQAQLSPSSSYIGRNGFIHCGGCARANEFESVAEAAEFLDL